MRTLTFIDLFAGIGGLRLGFEIACQNCGIPANCIFTSEIKPAAIKVLKQNHKNETIHGDITKIASSDIPDFDILLAGFPCQAFSTAGKRLGFEDTRGTLFFEVARILKDKKPKGFILENVEGLINHNKLNPDDKIGNTLQTILNTLYELGYKTSWTLLDASNFGLPQKRKRIYIVGSIKTTPNLENFPVMHKYLRDVIFNGLITSKHPFVKQLLSHYTVQDLAGKSLNDKRGGINNIHSWDIELKGSISKEEKELLNQILTERRKKKWSDYYGIQKMDGVPLTIDMIQTFNNSSSLENMIENLVQKGYLVKEYPKEKLPNGERIQNSNLPVGFNIVTGKLSFEVSKILDKDGFAPTLVAMDMSHLYVIDGVGLRQLTLKEGLLLCGYPDDYCFDVTEKEGYNLIGNTVCVPVITAVANRLLKAI